jgi:hypothetical protein
MAIFNSYVTNYQRVKPGNGKSIETNMTKMPQPSFTYHLIGVDRDGGSAMIWRNRNFHHENSRFN